jgi:general stress protein 26
MSVPVTEIDPRFSDPNAAATEWSETLRIIRGAELFWISTVRADGHPHVTPLVAVWLDGALHFTTGAQEQKALNLSANPHVALTTGCNSWQDGVDVVVEGHAIQVTDHARLVRLADAWRAKWNGSWQFEAGNGVFRHPSGGGEASVYAVKPVKVLAFAKGDGRFCHTRHLF